MNTMDKILSVFFNIPQIIIFRVKNILFSCQVDILNMTG